MKEITIKRKLEKGLLFMKPNLSLGCQKISWFSILQTLLPSKQFGIHLWDVNFVTEGGSWLARLKAVHVNSHVCNLCFSCVPQGLSHLVILLSNTMLFHPRAQSTPFPDKSGQWRWREGLGAVRGYIPGVTSSPLGLQTGYILWEIEKVQDF